VPLAHARPTVSRIHLVSPVYTWLDIIRASLSEPHTDEMYVHMYMLVCMYVCNSVTRTTNQRYDDNSVIMMIIFTY